VFLFNCNANLSDINNECDQGGGYLLIALTTCTAFRLRTALFLVITQLEVVIYYRSFGTTYRAMPLKYRFHRCPETSVINSHFSPRNNPQERSSHVLRGGILKSHIPVVLCSSNLETPMYSAPLVKFGLEIIIVIV
jgi:hypothetical protein